jgi:hypothetical protein
MIRLRILPPGSVIVLDNASFHYTSTTLKLVEAAGCHLLFLPAYSPDLNTIHRQDPLPQRPTTAAHHFPGLTTANTSPGSDISLVLAADKPILEISSPGIKSSLPLIVTSLVGNAPSECCF